AFFESEKLVRVALVHDALHLIWVHAALAEHSQDGEGPEGAAGGRAALGPSTVHSEIAHSGYIMGGDGWAPLQVFELRQRKPFGWTDRFSGKTVRDRPIRVATSKAAYTGARMPWLTRVQQQPLWGLCVVF